MTRNRDWRRRYTNARAVVALIVLAAFVLPGIAAVIAAAVSAL
jgi:hypothetical protein